MAYDPEEDYSAKWERRRRPCEKCIEYRVDSLGKMRCLNYQKVIAEGGVQFDMRGHDVMKKRGATWKGKRKTYWPFDYDPSLIVNGCPAMIPKEPYCVYCAQIFEMDNPMPHLDCQVCGKEGNICENCGKVDDECSKIYREQMDLRLCPACYKLLDDILEEVSEARRKAYQEAMNAANGQGDPDDAILCDNCESWFPADAMTAVEDGDAWLCPDCMEECGYEAEENAGDELHGQAGDDPAEREVSGEEGAGAAAPGEPEDAPEELAGQDAGPDPDKLGALGAGESDFAGEGQAFGGEGGDPADQQGDQEGMERGQETAAAAPEGVGEDGGEAAPESHPCQKCKYRKAMNSKFHGKRLGYPPGGKCIRAGGFCEGHPDYEPPGKPKRETMTQLKKCDAAALAAEQEVQA